MESTERNVAVTVGDTVLVPWGLDLVQGVVTDVYGRPGSQRAVVHLSTGEASTHPETASTITLPLGELVSADAGTERPGQWIIAQRYERALYGVLEGLAQDLQAAIARELPPDRGADFTLNHGNRHVIIEAKVSKPPNSRAATEQLDRLLGRVPSGAFLVIVTPKASAKMWRSAASAVGVELIEWDNSTDDEALKNRLTHLIEAA